MTTFWQGHDPWNAFERMPAWDAMGARAEAGGHSTGPDDTQAERFADQRRDTDVASEPEAFVHRAIQHNYYR